MSDDTKQDSWLAETRAAWAEVGREIFERLGATIRKPMLLLYLLLIIVGGGMLGTWLTFAVYRYGKMTAKDVVLSAATYVCAITATGLADTLMERDARPTVRLIILGLSIGSLLPLAVVIFKMLVDNEYTLAPTLWDVVLWTGLSTAVWIVANARDPRFLDVSPQAAAGGAPMRPLA